MELLDEAVSKSDKMTEKITTNERESGELSKQVAELSIGIQEAKSSLEDEGVKFHDEMAHLKVIKIPLGSLYSIKRNLRNMMKVRAFKLYFHVISQKVAESEKQARVWREKFSIEISKRLEEAQFRLRAIGALDIVHRACQTDSIELWVRNVKREKFGRNLKGSLRDYLEIFDRSDHSRIPILSEAQTLSTIYEIYSEKVTEYSCLKVYCLNLIESIKSVRPVSS